MEITNGNFGMGLVSRAVAFGMALVTTVLVTTATAVIFTGSTHTVGAHVAAAVSAPVRALLGA